MTLSKSLLNFYFINQDKENISSLLNTYFINGIGKNFFKLMDNAT